MIPSEFIQQLLDKVDIVDVIERYLPLKKAGQNYLACCPFHQEKTPSFTVSPTKQFFHCFGCGVHGSAVSFLMQHQGLHFVEAVQHLASSVNMSVPNVALPGQAISKAAQSEHLLLENLLSKAALFYQTCLSKSPQSLSYLKARGLSEEMMRTFLLGYAPEDSQVLVREYPNDIGLLVKAGLLIVSEEKKQTYSRFRGRIMFPIRNTKGAIIGFGARVIDPHQNPKYLNSPETVLFKKGQELYGLYEARLPIRESDRVLVVEGYMDVIALAQHGFKEVVATSGTAITALQIKKLLREADHIYFCFDGDEAGHKAAMRALENSLPFIKDDKSLHFLFLPHEHDPDSFIRSHSRTDFEEMIKQSIPLSSYLIKQLTEGINPHFPEGRAKLMNRAVPWVRALGTAPFFSQMIKNRLAELTGLSLADFEQQFGLLFSKKPSGHMTYRLPKVSNRLFISSLIHKQIYALLMHPEWVADAPSFDAQEELKGEIACFAAIIDHIHQYDSPPSSGALRESLRNTPYEALINSLMANMDPQLDAAIGDDQAARKVFFEGNRKLEQQMALEAKKQALFALHKK